MYSRRHFLALQTLRTRRFHRRRPLQAPRCYRRCGQPRADESSSRGGRAMRTYWSKEESQDRMTMGVIPRRSINSFARPALLRRRPGRRPVPETIARPPRRAGGGRSGRQSTTPSPDSPASRHDDDASFSSGNRIIDSLRHGAGPMDLGPDRLAAARPPLVGAGKPEECHRDFRRTSQKRRSALDAAFSPS